MYQDLIDRIDYFKSLNINAIELMPVMEFEGNESWGYNTVFHLALDKFYGPAAKLKEFKFNDSCNDKLPASYVALILANSASISWRVI